LNFFARGNPPKIASTHWLALLPHVPHYFLSALHCWAYDGAILLSKVVNCCFSVRLAAAIAIAACWVATNDVAVNPASLS